MVGGEPVARWQVEDVRAVTDVADLERRLHQRLCGFCEQPFVAAQWVALSVARPGVGGTTVDLCPTCAEAAWESLRLRLVAVAEMLGAADGQSASPEGPAES